MAEDVPVISVDDASLRSGSEDSSEDTVTGEQQEQDKDTMQPESSSPSSTPRKEVKKIVDMTTTATQTDDIDEDELYAVLDQNGPVGYQLFTIGSAFGDPGYRGIDSPLEYGLMDIPEGLEYADLIDACHTLDIEYEEVTLQRKSQDEKVGLTLCYINQGTQESEITDIFVSEIEEGSIAGHDGRVRIGDQILQINGEVVQNRDQAITLFFQDVPDITLLVARQIVVVDDGFMEGERLDDEFTSLDRHHGHNGLKQGDEDGSTDTVSTEKSKNDSGVGKTDGSTRTEDSSEHDDRDFASLASPGCQTTQGPRTIGVSINGQGPRPVGVSINGQGLRPVGVTNGHTNEHHESSKPCTEDQILEECDRIREVLDTKYFLSNLKEMKRLGEEPKRSDSESSIEREIAVLNKEMQQIQMECQHIVEEHLHNPSSLATHKSDHHKTSSFQESLANQMKESLANQMKSCSSHQSSPSRTYPKMGTRMEHPSRPTTHFTAPADVETHPPLWVQHTQLAQIGSARRLPGKSHIILPLDQQESPQHTDGKNSEKRTGRKSQKIDGPPCRIATSKPSKNSPRKTGPQTPSLANGADTKASVMRNCTGSPALIKKSDSSSSVSHTTQTVDNPYSLDDRVEASNVMYTNEANLLQTIALQQYWFQQQLCQQTQRGGHGGSCKASSLHNSPMRWGKGQSKSSLYGITELSPTQSFSPQRMPLSSSHLCNPYSNLPCDDPESHIYAEIQPQNNREHAKLPTATPGVQMEWVVKRRADGTRYITRRPVRNKLLKERAKKLNEERSGLTTDDDAMSELKVGRYWNKEERKRQLEKAKEYRRRKQELIKLKMEQLKEHANDQPNIIEMSQKKMNRHRHKKMFDGFTTVQEMLSHGQKGQGNHNKPLLSVTTV